MKVLCIIIYYLVFKNQLQLKTVVIYHVDQACKVTLNVTLQYRIVVGARLFIFGKNVILHGLIWSYMIIYFSNYLPKKAIFGYFRHFLTKIRAYMFLLDPTCLFKFEISSPYTLIWSYTTIRYCRVKARFKHSQACCKLELNLCQAFFKLGLTWQVIV